MPLLDIAQAQSIVRQAFEGQLRPELSKALGLLLKNARYDVNSPLLSMRVFGCVTQLPLSFHVLGRSGFPGHIPAEQGVAILKVLKEYGASPDTTVVLDGQTYNPLEFLREYAQRMEHPVSPVLENWIQENWAPTPTPSPAPPTP